VSQWLLPATAAPTTRPIHVSRSHKDAGPGVHFVSPGLLQLTVLWHRRRSHEAAAGAALASSSTLGGFQDGHSGLPVTVWQGSSLSAADCQLVSDEGRRQLRSATSRTCVVRRTYSNYGDRCCAAAGPKLWNSLLPTELRQADISFQRFKWLLTTFLFGC